MLTNARSTTIRNHPYLFASNPETEMPVRDNYNLTNVAQIRVHNNLPTRH